MKTSGVPSEGPASFLDTERLRGELKGRAVRGGAVTVASQTASLGLRLLSTAVLARVLVPDDFGLIAMVTAITGFVALFKDLGLTAATVQRAELSDSQVSNLFWINLLVSGAAAAATVALAPVIAWFYGDGRLVGITAGLSSALLFSGLAVQHQALLRRQMRFGRLAALDIGSLVIGIVVAILAALQGLGYWALVAMHVAIALVAAAGSWVACPWRPRRPARGVGTWSLVAFGGNVTGYNVANYAARHLDNVLIGRFWGGHQLGLYSKAYELLLLPIRQINSPLGAVAIPALSRLQNEPERYRRAYLAILEKLTMVTMPAVVLLIVCSDWVVRIVLGPQWLEAGRIFAFLGIAALTQPIGNSTGWLFISQGRAGDLFRWGLVGSGTAIASIVAGLPWGGVGVAASYALVGITIRTPLLLWYVGRTGPVRTVDFYRTTAPAAVAATAVAAVLLLLRSVTGDVAPVPGLLLASVASVLAAGLAYTALPAGRKALRETRQLLPLLMNRE